MDSSEERGTSRRRVLEGLSGAVGLAMLAGCSAPGRSGERRTPPMDPSDDSGETPTPTTSTETKIDTETAPSGRHGRYRLMPGTDHETLLYEYDSGVEGPSTLVVGGMHGEERSGVAAAEKMTDWEVDEGSFYVLPRANAVAVERGHHNCDHGDLNEAFPARGGKCDHWVAQSIWNVIETIDPDWTFDLHASYGLYAGSEGVGQAMFPTYVHPARLYARRTVNRLNDHYDLNDTLEYVVAHDLRATSPMLVHRVAGVLERPGYICETYRGGDTPLADQVDWHTFCVVFTLRQNGQLEPRRSR